MSIRTAEVLVANDSRWFYRDLVLLSSFEEAANGQKHTPLPEDWSIVICDVVGSTIAIEQGLYKNVNTIGAAAIVAVLNVDRSVPIPFIFGGDGASLAIPPHMIRGAKRALLGAQKLAQDAFKLDLRVGIVPISNLLSEGNRVAIGKYQLGTGVYQASFSGFGWDKAEELIKNQKTRSAFEVKITEDLQPDADFTGFECRWQPVKARHDHKLSILVRSLSKDPADHLAIYQAVIRQLTAIYGDSVDQHPLDVDTLSLTLNPRRLLGEILLKSNRMTFHQRLRFAAALWMTTLVGRMAMAFGVKIAGVDWGAYRSEVVKNSDCRKFDGTLKMVVDGTEEQYRRLETYLQSEHQAGHLVYGLHPSNTAIVTCIVFSHSEQHSHFVDGSDGGYTMAAKMLKEQLQAYQVSKRKVGG